MNWFLYIGGGVIWMVVSGIFAKAVVDVEHPRGGNVCVFIFLGTCLIWPWICWRFIK